ncbi:ATP-binding protein [Deinococcus peraridilitoris]|uniref:ATP-binding protein n=1 Tax=Deinococcus peraridilitoris TaxID=432329 RepID=UPI00059B8391|nr:ATP-binding protein [Deinococcus peraridilitoris]
MELVIFVGVQGSGKTSFYREHFALSHVHVSKDNFPHNRNKARRQRELIEQALQGGQSVVVDNTNSTPDERAEIIALGQAYGARVVGYVFVTPFADSLRRNRDREGKARVPDVALYVTRKRLRPPTADEGFDVMHAVLLTPQDTFEVTPYPYDEA